MVLPNFVPSFQVLKEMMIRSKQLLFEIMNLLPIFTSEESCSKMEGDIARLKKLVLKQHCYLRILIRYISSKMNCMEVGPGTKNSRPSSWLVGKNGRKRLTERAGTLMQNIEDEGRGEANASAEVSNAHLEGAHCNIDQSLTFEQAEPDNVTNDRADQNFSKVEIIEKPEDHGFSTISSAVSQMGAGSDLARSKRQRRNKYSREHLQEVELESETEEDKMSLTPKRKRRLKVEADYKSGEGALRKKTLVGLNDSLDAVIGNCRLCDVPLKLRQAADHMRECHRERSEELFVCPICAVETPTIVSHVRLYHHPDRFECDVCHKPFLQLNSMKRHRKIFHFPDEHDFICDGAEGCGKHFFTVHEFRRHKRQNHVTKTTVCEFCGKFMSANAKIGHIQQMHSDIDKTITCPKCGKTFSSVRRLKAHMGIHNPSKDFTCSVCNKAFVCPANLRQHMVSHKPPRHECKICGKMFLYRAAGLWTHLRQVHKADKYGNPMMGTSVEI